MSKKQDTPFTCIHSFADGRRCLLPPCPEGAGLCYFHAKKFQDALIAEEAGLQISHFLNTDVLTASELSSTFASLFSATVKGYVKPRTAATLTYLGRLMLQTQKLAKEEFLETFDDRWPKIVQEAATFNPPESEEPTENPAPDESTETADISEKEASTENTQPTPAQPIPFPKIM